MPQALSDFLAGKKLTELAQSETIKRSLPNPLPPALWQAGTNRPMGQQVEWEEVAGSRHVAQLVHSTSPSKRRNLQGVTRRFATAIGSKEHFVVDQELMLKLKSDNPLVAEGGRREVVRRIADFRAGFDNLRYALVASAICLGHIYADAEGNLLHSSSGAALTIDYGIPAGNRGQLDILGGGAIIGASWATSSTDIPLHLRNIRSQLLQKNGYNPRIIIHGANIPSYIAKNELCKDYLARNPAANAQIVSTNTIPDGLFDYTWVPGQDAFYVDATGAVRKFVGDDELKIIPEITPDWYEFVEAGTLVPNGVASPNMSLDQVIEQCTVVNGYFSYAELSTDPIFAKLIAGDYTLPVIKVPGAVLHADVTP